MNEIPERNDPSVRSADTDAAPIAVANSNQDEESMWVPAGPTIVAAPPPLDSNAVLWRERERRRQSLRSFLTILFMLLLLNDEQQERDHEQYRVRRRKNRGGKIVAPKMNAAIFEDRVRQNALLRHHAQYHPRYQALIDLNSQRAGDGAADTLTLDFNEGIHRWAQLHLNDRLDQFPESSFPKEFNMKEDNDESQKIVMHYGWNTTGFYRGDWKMLSTKSRSTSTVNQTETQVFSASQLQSTAREMMIQNPDDYAKVRFLPPGMAVAMRDDHNYTSMQYDDITVDLSGKFHDPVPIRNHKTRKLPLSLQNGKVAFQLYSRKIPAMTEMSLVEGFIKLYDSNMNGVSTQHDLLLRVRGIHLHSIGQLSLSGSARNVGRNALIVNPWRNETRNDKINKNETSTEKAATSDQFLVIPYPFVTDDGNETLRRERIHSRAARRMPQREQMLEENVGDCEFEISLDAKPVEWTLGSWRNLLRRRFRESNRLDPSFDEAIEEEQSAERSTGRQRGLRGRKKKRKLSQDEALVVDMVGTIHSPNCDFTAYLNVTALRTDWDITTNKGVTYSFYMVLVCLAQIVLLLRQLLHSQGSSAATRVSLLGIAWHTVIDALLCLGHVYLSLAIPSVFTAFASVAFFKMLVFCVIEMKYMSIIVHARFSGGEITAESLRRKVALVHLRFYSATVGVFVGLFYITSRYVIPYYLLLYSFWVPQIVLNIVTEAKQPLHKHFIYGMSITRLLAPLYFFGDSNNFLRDVYIDFQPNYPLCYWLIIWMGLQVGVLMAQMKYGARFMIPARFLPPKFDYHRVIPASMMPAGTLPQLPDLEPETSVVEGSSEPRNLHSTSNTTRSRFVKRKTGESSACPTLDCSICYDAIDLRSRHQYMLAPCNHLFHASCLRQWMDQKMLCPVCRTDLPPV